MDPNSNYSSDIRNQKRNQEKVQNGGTKPKPMEKLTESIGRKRTSIPKNINPSKRGIELHQVSLARDKAPKLANLSRAKITFPIYIYMYRLTIF